MALFKRNGIKKFDISYTNISASLLLKNILDAIIFCKDKFSVNDISSTHVEFEQNMFKRCSFDVYASNNSAGFIIFCKGSIEILKDEKDCLAIKYEIDNNLYFCFAMILAILPVLGVGFAIFQNPPFLGKGVLFLSFFELIIWIPSFIMFNIIPYLGLMNIFKTALEKTIKSSSSQLD